MNYLIVDLGTGNTRVALVKSDGEIIGIRTFTNTYYKDEKYQDSQYFIPEMWKEKILNCCKELNSQFPEITIHAVTSAGARQSIVLFDEKGKAFLGLPNIDNRGREYMAEIENKEEIYRISGKWVTEDFGAAKLLGYKKKYPKEFSAIAKVTSISEWIGAIFTGEIFIEPTQACEMQLYDLETKQWSKEICDAYGIDENILPNIYWAGTIAAPILEDFKEAFNMDSKAVFVVGGADTQTALNQTEIKEGEIAIVSGTTSPVVTFLQKSFYDEGQRVWVDAGLKGDGYIVETNPGATGLNYQRAKAMLLPDMPYEELELQYDKKTEFNCTASFSSLLFSEQKSLKKGGFFMDSPFSQTIDRVDMLWAVLGDIACATYEQILELSTLTQNKKTYMLGCGGGFQSETLCQMLADLSGRELRIVEGFEQATVRGLVTLCNEAFNEKQQQGDKKYKIYKPKKIQLIHKYYPIWLSNRNRANNL